MTIVAPVMNSTVTRRRGFTLTELAIVLGVIGLLLAAIWGALANLQDGRKAEQASAQLATIASNYRSLYNKGRRMTDADNTDLTATAIANGIFPADMAGATSAGVLGPWGGTVKIYASKTYNAVEIAYSNLSRKACNRLANAVVTGGSGAMAMLVDGNNGNGTPRVFMPYGTATAYTPEETAAICTNGASNLVGVYYNLGN